MNAIMERQIIFSMKYLSQNNRCTTRPIFVTTEEYPRVFLLQEEADAYCEAVNGSRINDYHAGASVGYKLCSIPACSSLAGILSQVIADCVQNLTEDQLKQARNIGVLGYDQTRN